MMYIKYLAICKVFNKYHALLWILLMIFIKQMQQFGAFHIHPGRKCPLGWGGRLRWVWGGEKRRPSLEKSIVGCGAESKPWNLSDHSPRGKCTAAALPFGGYRSQHAMLQFHGGHRALLVETCSFRGLPPSRGTAAGTGNKFLMHCTHYASCHFSTKGILCVFPGS